MRKGSITPARLGRLTQRVAPLMVQGYGYRRISEKLGIPLTTAADDCRLVKRLWVEEWQNSRDEWGGRITATYGWMLSELAQSWEQSKAGRITRVINPDGTELIRQEPPDPRWLSGMLAVAKEASTMLGIREGVDSVSRVEVPEATRQALAPMSADAYMSMIATTGGLAGINAVPPIEERQPAQLVEIDCLDQQEETATNTDGGQLPKQGPPIRGGATGRIINLQ